MSLTCLTGQMVNTRSGSGVDQPPVQRQRRGNNQQPNNMSGGNNQNNGPPPPPPAGMEQFLAAQTQLLTQMANAMANLQAQANQAPVPQPPQRDRHRDFMSHRPPTFSHSPDPLHADDWLKTIDKMLNIAQCTDREKVLYASGRLEGTAADWWDAYTAAHVDQNTITWDEFRTQFREHHIPEGLMKLKRQEFLALKQGGMSVSEYRDKFIQLSRYASADVATDGQKQDYFRLGLLAPIRYQLLVHRFDSFQKLVDNAIAVENARKEMGEQKRKFESQGQSSNSRPRFGPPQGNQYRTGGQNVNFGQNQYQYQRPAQQYQQNQQLAQRSTPQQNRQNTPAGTPVRNNNPAPSGGNACFKCGQLGHFAHACPNRNNQGTPGQSSNSGQRQTPQQQQPQQQQQPRNNNQTPQGNRGQQNYVHGRVNHVAAESTQEAQDVVFGMFLINSAPASVLFDSGATHSFISAQFVAKHSIPLCTMPRTMLVNSPGGNMKAMYRCFGIRI